MKLQLKKLLKNNLLLISIFFLMISNSCFRFKKSKKALITNQKIDTLPQIKGIYHYNPISYEDSLNNAIFELKIKIAFMHFYKTRTQLTKNEIDSIYNSGYRVDDSIYYDTSLKYGKEVMEKKSKNKK